MTNGDKVRKMTDEELAELLSFRLCCIEDLDFECPERLVPDCDCSKAFLNWLKKDVKG